ncbi:ATP-dependent DNA ligase [Actinophytocola xinjiangensis]|uniref:DNA ligase (ATP) n=1 Tax=Actinophytocola xinjiangensis TaxID=485602 RepID=A0A7Z1AVT6_9PSEU|nr:non-homologous end-joining DNA ligase [Actinophytocola xinjiangensis]OLF06111.1 ATP-dependent DNA ligase [Actinophytocola xinjiangensis]
MLATVTDRRFTDDDWIFERELDGLRTLSTRDGWRPRLWNRKQRSIDLEFPELVDALSEFGGPRFVADGEIVTVTDTPRRVHYYLFDLLALDGEDLRSQPLIRRKALLRNAFRFHDPLRYCEHRARDGEAYYQYARAQGWEGLIAKRADSPYLGGRSEHWLKFKCVRGQEFVVGGFTDPQGSRAGFGALLVGYHEHGRLRYAGKVGTGYDHATLRTLRARLDLMAQAESPFADETREPTAHWVRPELVIQVGFSEWTTQGRLRHPRFGGLRGDRPATDVVREPS